MRSLMLVLGACLAALNFAGCSSTGSCGCGLMSDAPLSACGSGATGCAAEASTGDCGCGESACGGEACKGQRFGGRSGLGLGLMEAGPACRQASCNGGCNSCQSAGLRDRLQQRVRPACRQAACDGGCDTCEKAGLRDRLQGMRPNLIARVGSRSGACGQADCGGASTAMGDCGCGSDSAMTPAPALESSDCGCNSASTGIHASFGDDVTEGGCDGGCEGGCDGSEVEVQTVEFQDRGLLGKLGFGRNLGSRIRSTAGCGHAGCGLGGKLCQRCRSGMAGGMAGGMNLGSRARGCGMGGCGGPGGLCRGCLAGLGGGGRGAIPHRQPPMNPGAAGQSPTYAYPYYTTRAPRDFLDPNPPTIGY